MHEVLTHPDTTKFGDHKVAWIDRVKYLGIMPNKRQRTSTKEDTTRTGNRNNLHPYSKQISQRTYISHLHFTGR